MRFANIADTVVGFRVGSAEASTQATALALEKPFEGKGGFVDWAETITIILALLIVGLILFTRIFRRHLTPPRVTLLYFASLCALPLGMMSFGSFATFEGSKRDEFCHSCHSAMDLYVDDMRDKESKTLAAVHYNNRYIQEEHCYSCHADYGVAGTAEAKFRGLKHLYYWVTNSATARGTEQIRTYGSYKNDLCLNCHAGSQTFLKADGGTHRAIALDLVGKDPHSGESTMSCLFCHGPAHLALANKKNIEKGRQ